MNYVTLAQYPTWNPYGTGDVPVPPEMLIAMAFGLILLVTIYFIPYLIARSRNLVNQTLIFWLNLLLGWTAIFWLILFIVSLVGRSKDQNVIEVRLVKEILEKQLSDLERKEK